VPNLVAGYDLIARSETFMQHLQPDRVLCLHDWPTSKALRQWLQAGDTEVTFVCSHGQNPDALHSRTRLVRCHVESLAGSVQAGAKPRGWLAGWLGVTLDENEPAARRRELVARGVDLLARRGTVGGLRDALRAYLAVEADISEPGGTGWSMLPGSPLPGSATGEVVVRITVEDPGSMDVRRIDAVVATMLPAGIGHRVELSGR